MRRQLPDSLKGNINEEFQHRCAYCRMMIGGVVMRRGRYYLQEPEYDHFRPFSNSHDNSAGNYVLACSICNNLKGTDLYESIDAVTLGIAQARDRYTTVWETPVSMTEDLRTWGVKYATWLASGRTRIVVEQIEEEFDAAA